jgi:alpha-aminoadipic semialdehyde synthase
VREGVQVLVQPSNVRIATDLEYQQAGAQIAEDLSPCNVILGVKEVPVSKLLNDRTYAFFSHTTKAQEYNMPLLDACISKNIQLMDYERIAESEGNRLVKFGKFAGFAGMIDMFHGLGDRLLAMGYSTPFLHVGFTRMYSGLPAAEEAVKIIGEQIAQGGLPRELGPLVFAFTGNGSVGRGAQQIFNLLPHKVVSPEELKELVADKDFDNHVVYTCTCTSRDLVEPIDPNRSFDRKDYFANPQDYKSIFAETVAPYASVIVNGVFWNEDFPRILTIEQLEKMHKTRTSRLLAVADLSCDVGGSIEFMRQVSSIDHPFYVWDIEKREVNWDTVNAPGVLLLAVDNLPTEIPVDATNYFGDSLLPWIESLVKTDVSVPFEEQELPLPLKNAVLTSHGALTPGYQYIDRLRQERTNSKKAKAGSKKILIIGSGMVSPPAIQYLAKFRDNLITVASANLPEAEMRVKSLRNAKAVELDVDNTSDLSGLIAAHDIVVSLLPAGLHMRVARQCIDHGVHMITTSYVSPEMEELHREAEAKGVTILNEVGLDPGIDHLTAMKVIRECKEKGGTLTHFTSYCGGLPAPEASSNPLGYKFSWAPRGALLAGLNGALYITQGQEVSVPEGGVFKAAEPIKCWPGFNLEGYPNRDSVQYAEDYGVPHAKHFFRGTLRYKGFSEIFDALVKLGFVNPQPLDQLQPGAAPITWRELALILQPDLTTYDLESGSLRKLGLEHEEAAHVDEALNWLGVFSGEETVAQKGNPLDSLCEKMLTKMNYGEGEHDMVILRHDFEMVIDGKDVRMSSSMVRYGETDGHSAMAYTVGMPAGIATKLVLDGHIIRRGVLRPLTPDIVYPMLNYLEGEGIKMIEEFY